MPSWLPAILDLAAPLVDYPLPISKIVIKGKHRIYDAQTPLFCSQVNSSKVRSSNIVLCTLAAFDSFWTSHRSTWSSASSMFDSKQLERLTDVFERIRSNVLCA